MQLNLGPRAQAAVVLALVAVIGALLGIIADRALAGASARAESPALVGTGTMPVDGSGQLPQGGPWRWEARAEVRYADRLGGALALSAEQRAEIDRIVAEEQARVREVTREVEPRFRAIAGETRQRIEAVLTEEQRERLRGLREARIRVRPDRLGPGGAWHLPRDSAAPASPRRRP